MPLRFRNYVDNVTIKLDPVTGAAFASVGGGFTLTGALRQIPTSVPLVAGAATVDASLNNTFFLSAALTVATALTFTNFQDGDLFTLAMAQDGAGGHKISGIAAAGRTVMMDSTLGATLNTPDFLVASAPSLLTAVFFTEAGTPYCLVTLTSGIAAAFA